MYPKLRAMLLSAVLLVFGAGLSTAFAQPFTWSKAGSRPQDYDMGGDPTAPHGSANTAFIKSKGTTINGSGSFKTSIAPSPYRNQAIRLSAYVKTANFRDGFVNLWLSVEGPGGEILSFDDMSTRQIVGTTDWAQYEIVLDVPENSQFISFGIFMFALGEAYVDGLQIKPAARTWNVISLAMTQTIYSLKAVGENTVWGGATDGMYIRSTDGGTTWRIGTVAASTFVFNAIAAIDDRTAYFTGQRFPQGGDARIYKTIDGGATWTEQYRNTGVGAFFNSIAFWDANNGVAVGDPVDGSFLIVTTADGGATWSRVPAVNIPPPQQNEFGGFGDAGGTTLFVQGKNNAWFGTGNRFPIRVISSTDKGQTWTSVSTPLSTSGNYYGIQTLAFADSFTGFAGGFQFPYYHHYRKDATTLVKTTDGGLNWTPVSSLKIEPSTMQYVPNTNNRMMITSSRQGAAYSNDGGDTWQLLPSTQPTVALSFASSTVGWAASTQVGWAASIPVPRYEPAGKIFKFVGNLRTTVVEQRTSLAESFHLAQNYPNPFNPSTMIQYELPHAEYVQLAIYNLLGEKVRTLVDAKESAGVKHITWDGRNDRGEAVSSGVYVYRITAGELKLTKRLLLMK